LYFLGDINVMFGVMMGIRARDQR